MLVEFDDEAFDAAEVLGSGAVVEAHTIADIQHGERFRGFDRLQKVLARVDGIGDRCQVRVQLSCRDLVQQEPLRLALDRLRFAEWTGWRLR